MLGRPATPLRDRAFGALGLLSAPSLGTLAGEAATSSHSPSAGGVLPLPSRALAAAAAAAAAAELPFAAAALGDGWLGQQAIESRSCMNIL